MKTSSSTKSQPRTLHLFFFDSVLPKLKHSLSLTLLHFLPVAGNLTWPPTSPVPAVEYSESDAVSLTVAMSDADHFHSLFAGTDHVFYEATEFHSLIPKLSASHDRVAVLAIQVTVFPNHGFSIGITSHHAVLDGKSFVLFLKSWAHICGSLGSKDCSPMFHQLPPELKPVYDRTQIKDPSNLGNILSDRWLNMDGVTDNRSLLYWEVDKVRADSVRGTFQLPRGKIEKLRRLVEKMANSQVHASTFSITCAYTWICLEKAEEEINDSKIRIAFFIDFRSRLQPPIPTAYFGNCAGDDITIIEREALLGKGGLLVVVNAISEAIKRLDNEGLLNGSENWVPPSINEVKTLQRVYSVASSPRFELYKTDFGWGKPRKVDVISIDRTGAASLSDNRNGDGGVEIGLVLRKRHMKAFASLFAKGLESL